MWLVSTDSRRVGDSLTLPVDSCVISKPSGVTHDGRTYTRLAQMGDKFLDPENWYPRGPLSRCQHTKASVRSSQRFAFLLEVIVKPPRIIRFFARLTCDCVPSTQMVARHNILASWDERVQIIRDRNALRSNGTNVQ